ncbi:hypothetical protein [Shinella sp.]|uniref:hypothetical protein n=1 Tax=Shinella sp. TaxID=1870904 RepID=UPI003F6F7646
MTHTFTRLIVPMHGELNISPDIQQLTRELSVALSGWKDGQFSAFVHPANDPRGVRFKSYSSTLETRLREVTLEYRLIAEQIDPSAKHWYELRDADPSLKQRFMIVGEQYGGGCSL